MNDSSVTRAARPAPGKFKQLKNYGCVGNTETTALIGKDGAVDWLCLPDLDSPSVFAWLLDLSRHERPT